MIGANSSGELRPGFDAQVIADTIKRFTGHTVSPEHVHGMDNLTGCGLFPLTVVELERVRRGGGGGGDTGSGFLSRNEMPFWIQGWLEVTTDGPHDAEAIWQAVVDLGPLVDTSDEISEHLFGLSKRFRSDPTLNDRSLFAERGVPAVRSLAVNQALDNHRQLAAQHGPTGIGGYTFANYAEIRAAGVNAQNVLQRIPIGSWFLESPIG